MYSSDGLGLHGTTAGTEKLDWCNIANEAGFSNTERPGSGATEMTHNVQTCLMHDSSAESCDWAGELEASILATVSTS